MRRIRSRTTAELDRAIRTVASHLPAPPPVSPLVAAYVARHGVSHLVAHGDWAEALQLADRLENCAAEALFGTRTDRSREGLLRAMESCPLDAEIDLEALGRLLHRQATAAGCRAACSWLVRSEQPVDAPFTAQPNASRPVTYALAEVLAEAAEAKGATGLAELSAWAEDFDRPTQYAAMYAFKYVGMKRPEWLTDELLRPHCSGNPYDRMVATGLLLYLAIQGDSRALAVDATEFWEPEWEYNQVEIDLLRGALRWRGLSDAGGEEDAAYFEDLDRRRLGLLENARSPAVREVLDRYWALLNDLPAVDRALRELPRAAEATEVLWLLMSSPYWEVGERAAGAAARWARADEDVAELMRAWALDEAQGPAHMGAIVALRTLTQEVADPRLFHEAASALSASEDPQVRGYVANAVASYFQDVPKDRWSSMVSDWADVLRAGLHDSDLWAVQETVELVRELEAANVDWTVQLDREAAPLLKGINGWIDMDWDELFEALDAPQEGSDA